MVFWSRAAELIPAGNRKAQFLPVSLTAVFSEMKSADEKVPASANRVEQARANVASGSKRRLHPLVFPFHAVKAQIR